MHTSSEYLHFASWFRDYISYQFFAIQLCNLKGIFSLRITWAHVVDGESIKIMGLKGLKNSPLAPLRGASIPFMSRYPDISIATVFEQKKHSNPMHPC
jgi:hypothetical protein